MRRRRNRKKLSIKVLLWLGPPLLLLLAVLVSPKEGAGAEPQGVELKPKGKLEAGRHYDWVARDSVVKLMDLLDAGQSLAQRVQSKKDTFSIILPTAEEDRKAVRIFLNRRDPADYPERLADDTPFRVRPQGKRKFGFHFATREENGRTMIAVPFDMLAGMLGELKKRNVR